MIHSLWIKNFRRYKEARFSLVPGINFIEGPNNAGKTTILYAIEYALFGRVGSFSTPLALLHPGEDTLGVELVFTGRDGARYRLQRIHTRPPRAKTKILGHFTLKRQTPGEEGERYLLSSDFQNREEELALALHGALGISRRLFEVAVHLRQGKIAAILEGAPELDIVLGVTAAVVASEEMRAMALEREKLAATLPSLEETLKRLESDRAFAGTRLFELEEAVRGLDEEVLSLNEALSRLSETGARIAPLLASHNLLEDAVKTYQSAVSAESRARNAFSEFVSRAGGEEALLEREARTREALSRLARAQASAASRERDIMEQRRPLDREHADVMGRIQRRELLSGKPVCETCGQPIDRDRSSAELLEWRKDSGRLEKQLDLLETQLKELQKVRAETEEARSRELQVLRMAEQQSSEVRHLARSQAEASEGTRIAEEALKLAASRAHPVFSTFQLAVDLSPLSRDDPGPILALLHPLSAGIGETRDHVLRERVRKETEREGALKQKAQAERELSGFRERLGSLDRERARIETEADRLRTAHITAGKLRTLSEAFRGLQTALRDRAAEALAQETLKIHKHLSSGPDEFRSLRIDPARYGVFVTPSDVGQDVPAHLFQGGGHQLLLGLAFKLAVAKLVDASSFVLLDEPTYGLDQSRREGLLARISELDIARQLVLITHHDVGNVAGHHLEVVRKGSKSEVDAGHLPSGFSPEPEVPS